VASFPGTRNWGYDGVHLFSVQESYGGPAGLARLVHAAHAAGLAVILDVVYNHLGPEGNYLREFAPYFTAKHATPWGEALNYDDEGSSFVRSWVIDNALQWVRDYRIDGLRLDAIHAIRDESPRHVLAEVGAAVQAVGGFVISESDLNDPITVLGRPDGWGHDAQWSDDLHHALHALLTGERGGYYADFGSVADVATALQRGFVYDGTRPSRFRGGALHGRSTAGIPAERHVVCLQNHDQVGNRARGDRIGQIAGLEAQKVGAATVLLAPGVPLIFMGEEWAASQPFPYFTSYGDPALGRAATEGRRREFASFGWQGAVPDPQAEETFRSAVLRFEEREAEPHRGVLAFYRALLALRRTHPALRGPDRQTRTRIGHDESAQALWMERWSGDGQRLLALFAYAREAKHLDARLPAGDWRLRLDSGDARFAGPGGKAPATLEGGVTAVDLPPTTAWIYVEAPMAA
jgi:maltooligosyltrehalose trehalohydrolase